jgi:hypothetical protein
MSIMPNPGNKSATRVRHGDLRARLATLRAGNRIRIPLDYQDESGFHYGIEPIASFLERLVESPAS